MRFRRRFWGCVTSQLERRTLAMVSLVRPVDRSRVERGRAVEMIEIHIPCAKTITAARRPIFSDRAVRRLVQFPMRRAFRAALELGFQRAEFYAPVSRVDVEPMRDVQGAKRAHVIGA